MKIYHTALGVCDTYEVVTEPPLGYSWECERMRAAIPYLERIGM